MSTLKPITAETASGEGLPLDLDADLLTLLVPHRYVALSVDVAAIELDDEAEGGLVIGLESSDSPSGPWRLCSSEQVTEVGAHILETVSFARFVRVRWTIRSGDSATFGVTGASQQVFADFADFAAYGLPGVATRNLQPTIVARALLGATGKVKSKLSQRFDLPILAWGIDVCEVTAKIAGYDALSAKGFNPDGRDENVRTRHNDAMTWLRDVVDSRANPVGLIDSTPLVEDDGIAAYSDPPRWGRR